MANRVDLRVVRAVAVVRHHRPRVRLPRRRRRARLRRATSAKSAKC